VQEKVVELAQEGAVARRCFASVAVPLLDVVGLRPGGWPVAAHRGGAPVQSTGITQVVNPRATAITDAEPDPLFAREQSMFRSHVDRVALLVDCDLDSGTGACEPLDGLR
jgi:hypothetical protein